MSSSRHLVVMLASDPFPMATQGVVFDLLEERRRQRAQALEKLIWLERDKSRLKRPVFFIPGWTDEDCRCWTAPYKDQDLPIRYWMKRLIGKTSRIEYVIFTTQESRSCKSFFDFGDILRKKIWRKIGKNQPFDLVGHSMGGLDAVAAIIDDLIDRGRPLMGVHHLITVGTPHQGTEFGEIAPLLRKYQTHHAIQCINLDPDEPPIQFINQLRIRKTLLSRLHKLYCVLGTRDMAVMRSAKFNVDGLSFLQRRKVETVELGGATHSQKQGITQDPRLILSVLQILLDIPMEKPQLNYGYIYRKAA